MPTDPAKWEMVDDATADVLRRMTPAQRLAIADDLFRMARGVLSAQVENEHPNWEPEQIKREAARQLLLGVEPPGCDLAAWFRLHADEYSDGPWTADKPHLVATKVGNAPIRGA